MVNFSVVQGDYTYIQGSLLERDDFRTSRPSRPPLLSAQGFTYSLSNLSEESSAFFLLWSNACLDVVRRPFTNAAREGPLLEVETLATRYSSITYLNY